MQVELSNFIKSFQNPVGAIEKQLKTNPNFLSCSIYDWADLYGIEVGGKTEDQLQKEIILKIS